MAKKSAAVRRKTVKGTRKPANSSDKSARKPTKNLQRRSGPVSIADYVRLAAMRLKRAKLAFAHGTTDPVAEAAFLVGETLGLHPDDVAAVARRRVRKNDGARIVDLVTQRISTRKPAAYLVQRMYMHGIPFYVDERTIVPRSFIGEILLSHFSDDSPLQLMDPARVKRVLDLCTGSGCLAVLAALAFPMATIDAVDLSADALEVAKRNIDDHGLTDRIRLVQGDLLDAVGGERYDLIITNPPYVDAEGMAGLPPECIHEPAIAFDGGADGIDLVRRILSDARTHLADDGGLLCEVGRCRPALEAACPNLPFLWLDTEESEGEVFWLEARDL